MAQVTDKFRWTTRAIESVTVLKRTDFTDPDTAGLSLRVTPTGSKSWALLYRRKGDAKRRRVTLGEFPALGMAEARAKARSIKVQITAGADPAGDLAGYRKAETVSDLLDQFIEKHPRPDAAWTKECTRIFQKDVRPLIGRLKLPDLKRQHVRQVIETVRGRGVGVAVNRTLAALRRAFSWAVSKDLLETNPALNLATDIEEKHKDRALSVEEIKAFWGGIDSSAMSLGSQLALRLILVTGQRPGEVCGARADEISFDRAEWRIPAKRAKNRKPHSVPLSPLAIELFSVGINYAEGNEFIFPTRTRNGIAVVRSKALESHALSHAMRKNLKVLGLADNPATPHDLRRTVATHMARIGSSERIVGRVLNHSSEQNRTVTSRVYIHHDYAQEKRIVLEAWALELANIIAEKPSPSNLLQFQAKA